MEKNKSDDILLDDWEDALLEQLIQTEEQFVLTSTAPKPPPNPTSSSSSFSLALPPPLPPPPPPPPPSAVSFSPPREFSQRPTTSITLDSPSPTPIPISDNKDLEIDRLKVIARPPLPFLGFTLSFYVPSMNGIRSHAASCKETNVVKNNCSIVVILVKSEEGFTCSIGI